tara:strand:- start:9 stop:608 length:600 start_codon:yes stop_codon:yes gene_type:complete
MTTYFTGEFYADSAIMYEYLNMLELKTGNERCGTKFFNKLQGSKKGDSMKFGYTWKKFRGPISMDMHREFDEDVGLYKTILFEQNPWLMDAFKEYINYHFKGFDWSEVQINRMPTGTRTKQHLDKINVGESVLIAFGDFTGGKTYIQNKNDKNYDVLDCRYEPAIFNGAERLHGVDTVTSGLRYSLVFYKNKLKPIKKY